MRQRLTIVIEYDEPYEAIVQRHVDDLQANLQYRIVEYDPNFNFDTAVDRILNPTNPVPTDPMSEAYQTGQFARRKGAGIHNVYNVYDHYTQPLLWEEWRRGWTDEDHALRTGKDIHKS